jgi:methylated-DNA-[protein]-cysteine S-methyltransferase
MLSHLDVQSPLGTIRLAACDGALTHLSTAEGLDAPPDPSPFLEEAADQLLAYLSGSRRHFTLPMRPAGTPFQQKVWEELTRIPFGTTITYAELARRTGNPRGVRAAASAIGRNPIPIFIPCHRVIGADGSLTGFSWGGVGRKRRLLELEGVHLD